MPTPETPSVCRSLELELLHAVLNQVDYGLAVVNTDNQQLVFANPLARQVLQSERPDGPPKTGLVLVGDLVCTRQSAHAQAFSQALQRTKFGQRVFLKLVEAEPPLLPTPIDPSTAGAVAVMPLTTPGYALLAFAKQHMCDTTTITLFAQERGLTSTESQVLAQVCKGLRPQQIATHQGVQVSTVRTHLRAIRLKTASDSVRELIEKVSVLPPLAQAGRTWPEAAPIGGIGTITTATTLRPMDENTAMSALGLLLRPVAL